MFSRREREYLRWVADRMRSETRSGAPEVSPGYRRKLEWSIRRKASRAFSDWELYVSAAEHDPRVLAVQGPSGPGEVPLYADPFVVAMRAVASSLRRLSARPRREDRRGR